MEQVTTKQVRASWLRSSIGTVWEVVFKIYKNSVDLFLPLQYMYMQMYLYMERKSDSQEQKLVRNFRGYYSLKQLLLLCFGKYVKRN